MMLATSPLTVFFFHDPATTEIYTLSLHDALPIPPERNAPSGTSATSRRRMAASRSRRTSNARSEEHTSELQSQFHLVCRLLLEKKNIEKIPTSLQGAP